MSVKAPDKFDGGEAAGIKQFKGIAFIQTKELTERNASLIGATASEFPLASYKTEGGSHRCCIRILSGDLNNDYLQVTYIRGTSRDWPILIHIPVVDLIRQLKKQNKEEPKPNPPSD